MQTPIDKLSVRDLLGPILQFITNLLGAHGPLWWEAFKKLLVKGMVGFKYDMSFSENSGGPTPKLHSFTEDLIPEEILRRLAGKNLRMGTTEELISYMGRKSRDRSVSAAVFSIYGPQRIPCLVSFSCNEVGSFELAILHNQDTAGWNAGIKFLVFPIL